jgi:predicted Zn-dependent protease
MIKKYIYLSVILILIITLTLCKDDRSVNIFTVSQDIEFGMSLDEEIKSHPADYPLLSRAQYPLAYEHLERIRNNLLASDELKYADRFPWEVKIIHDSVLNAFAAPGGYMYFYSGLIEFLENEAQFAGVMAHEMAHCDRRHSTDNLTKQYGISLMVGMILGDNPSKLSEIATDLASGLGLLAFSRQNEYEADEYAVKYLKTTEYNPCALGDFFGLLEAQVGSTTRPPVFLSTHPSPEDRLDRINENCAGGAGQEFESRYQEFQNSLPSY